MIKYLDLTLGILAILYYVYLKLVYGGIAFSEFFIALGMFLIIYHFIKDKLRGKTRVYKCVKSILAIFISIFIIVESILIFYPKSNIKGNCDYLMILGAAVKRTTPRLTLKGRLDTAIEYLDKSDDDCYIVVSGGKGNGEDISEAEAMKRYLIKNGVDKDKIIIENKSTSTYENFKFSKTKIEKHSKRNISDIKVKVITTDFHSFRSSLLAKRNGYKNTTFYTSNSLKQFRPVYYTREFFATIKTIILDR